MRVWPSRVSRGVCGPSTLVRLINKTTPFFYSALAADNIQPVATFFTFFLLTGLAKSSLFA
jgi:hypothetical protein